MGVVATSNLQIALIAAGGAVAGALIGGAISFAGIVYAARRERTAGRRRELLEALSAYLFATDLYASHLETLPPPDPESKGVELLTRVLIGSGERSQWAFSRLIAEWLFPQASAEIGEMRNRYYEASGRLSLIAPPRFLAVANLMTECFLEWQEHPGQDGLERYGPIRRELMEVSRELVGSEEIPVRGGAVLPPA